jgi:hypothetical protein
MIDRIVERVLSKILTKYLPPRLNMYSWGIIKGVYDAFQRRIGNGPI